MMVSMKYPKVLIVSADPLEGNSQTSITLSNIWSEWRKDCIFDFVISQPVKQQNAQPNMYFLPLDRQPLLKIAKGSLGKKINVGMKKEDQQDAFDKKSTLKKHIRQWAYSLIDRSGIWLKDKDYAVVREFAPEVIYTMGSSVSTMRVCITLAQKLSVPIIMHFMDNWPECVQWAKNPLLRNYKKSLERWLDKVYTYSKCALTISEEMAQAYEKKTGIKHISLMNSINIEFWQNVKYEEHDHFVFAYAGGMHLGRFDTLLGIGNKLHELNQIENKNYKLVIYTDMDSKYVHSLSETELKEVEIRGKVKHDDLKKVYREADVLILAEGLKEDKITNLFAKYSISTKTAEYLVSGKPILYVGDSSRALPRYLERNDAAVVVTQLGGLQDGIEMLTKRSESLCQNAFLLAKKNHDKNKVNAILQNAINISKGKCI